LLELADDVQPDIGKFVLQQVQEELQKVIDGGSVTKERCKPSDLVCKGSTDMLGAILTQIPNKRYYASNDNLRFQQFRETFKDENRGLRTPVGNYCYNTWNLPCGRCAHFRFIVLQ
jgi:hypothetical protein